MLEESIEYTWNEWKHQNRKMPTCKPITLKVTRILTCIQEEPAVSYRWTGWRADHTGQFRHHMSASPAVIVKKMVSHHLFLNIILSNFTARTERKVWCGRGKSLRNNRLKFKTSRELPIILEESIEYTSKERKHQNWKMSTCKPVGFTITRILTNYNNSKSNFPGTAPQSLK